MGFAASSTQDLHDMNLQIHPSCENQPFCKSISQFMADFHDSAGNKTCIPCSMEERTLLKPVGETSFVNPQYVDFIVVLLNELAAWKRRQYF